LQCSLKHYLPHPTERAACLRNALLRLSFLNVQCIAFLDVPLCAALFFAYAAS
jgi:hypothetical protein